MNGSSTELTTSAGHLHERLRTARNNDQMRTQASILVGWQRMMIRGQATHEEAQFFMNRPKCHENFIFIANSIVTESIQIYL